MGTIVHIQNKVLLRPNANKTPYELWTCRPKSVKYFRVFGTKCYIMRDDGKLGKFDSRLYEGIFLGYSCTSKAYKCYHLRLKKIVESINVRVDEAIHFKEDKEEHEEHEE